MQTVNFNCPHCGNLMAVGANLLGRNVRCPHCKHVVQAPTAPGQPVSAPPPPPPPAAPTPQFNLPKPPSETHESIFGERHDEDLFGSEPEKPTLPSAPAVYPPTVTIDQTAASSPYPPPPPRLELDETVQLPPSAPSIEPLVESLETTETGSPVMDYGEPPPPPRRRRAAEPEGREERAPYERRVAPESSGSGVLTWILLGYGVIVTLLAAFFGYEYLTSGSKGGDNPFKAIPDVFGQYEKANRKETSFNGMPNPKADLPPEQKVKLGEEITVGDLQVTPDSVKRKVLVCTTQYAVQEDKSREVRPETLVLTLKVKNLSSDTSFFPNDPAFNRAAPRDDKAAFPYTSLQVDKKHYCGIFNWPPAGDTKREFVVGFENDERPLKPGEERETWVTVAPKDDVLGELKAQPLDKALLWRVQLRRGLVRFKDQSGTDREISATTVIGVTFRKDQIK